MDMGEIRRAIDLLTSSQGDFDVVEIQPDGSVRLVSFDGSEIVLEVRSAHFPATVPTGEPPRGLFETRAEWTQEVLRKRGLPPEWNRDWLVEQLARAELALRRGAGRPSQDNDEGLREIARTHGRPLEALREMTRLHGIGNAREEYVRRLWASGRYATQEALADALGISEATVSRYVGQAVQSRKRGEQNEAVRQVVQELLTTHGHLHAKAFNDEVYRLLVEHHGERRSRAKITHLVRRFRQESGG